MSTLKHLTAALLGTLVVASAQADSAPGPDCQGVGKLKPYCGFAGSEDLEVLPGGRALLVSEIRIDFNAEGMHWHPGGIGLLNLATGQPTRLYPTPHPQTTSGPGPWGDPRCPGEIGPALSPHGLHLSQRQDGSWQLLVVNHGGRESVEFFEVTGLADKSASLGLAWRGCLPLAPTQMPNDVVALPGGGLLLTDMAHNGGPQTLGIALAQAARGESTGRVVRWRPDQGMDPVPGTDAPLPNGIQINRAGDTIFVAVGGRTGGEILKIDLAKGTLLGAVPVPRPDNISWSPDGHLLVASLPLDSNIHACFAAPSRQLCPAAFQIVAVNPTTLASQKLFSHQGPPLGGATAAVQVGRNLYVGSFAGGRVLKAPLPGL